jgi:tRNA(His) guanylyltransferase
MSLLVNKMVTFDSRLWVGPNEGTIVDYFRWRQSDATRCALYGHAYWALRAEGLSASKTTSQLLHAGVAAKNELLFQRGINFNELPTWQRRGVGLYFANVPHEGFNPKTGKKVTVTRRRLIHDRELPMGNEYGKFILSLLSTEV